jgi:protein disulfide-isomerase A1
VPLILLLCSSGFPTLRLYADGIPTEPSYDGSRSAEAIVAYVKRSIVPPVTNLPTEAEVTAFVKNVNDDMPVFLGFGLETSALEDLAKKYKRKAWFAAITDVSQSLMVNHDFDKTPALVNEHLKLNERTVFYGPFEGMLVELG